MGGDHTFSADHKMMIREYKKRFIVSIILTVPILLLDPSIQKFLGYSVAFCGQNYILFLIASTVYFYGGSPFLRGSFTELSKKTPGMMVLIGIALTTAYLYSILILSGLPGKPFLWELATLIDVMLIGHWIEMKSILGVSRALEEMVKLLPSKAHMIREDGTTIDVPVEHLIPDDMVLVKPGEKIPVDGVVIEGQTSVNEAMLTGESRPISKDIGDAVIAGSINEEGSVVVKVQRTEAETYISKVIELVKQARKTRSKTQDLADRAAFMLTTIALLGGSLTLIIWMLVRSDIVFALERAVTVMVITCPHALGLAVPLVVAVLTSLAARNGFLIRKRDAFERARGLQAVVFDKTGTLTTGKFGVTEIISLSNKDEYYILRLAAALESNSEHSIAQGIVNKAVEIGIDILKVDDFKAIPGRGVDGRVGDKRVRVISPGYLKDMGMKDFIKKASVVHGRGKTIVFVLEDDKPIGVTALGDLIREESREAVRILKKMGLRVIMLTGDNRVVGEWVSRELDLDEYYVEVLPHEKVNVIKAFQNKGLSVAMVGDGINDAPALIQSDVGIAIGAGTDIAIESADIILVRNDPRDVVSIIFLAKKTYGKMLQNLLWATGYNSFAIPLAAGVLYNIGIILSPAIGAILMSLSTVVVAVNARSLKF